MRFVELLLLAHCARAIKLPFVARTVPSSTARRHLRARADVTGEFVNTKNGSVPIANTQNAEYIANITLNGQTVPVMLDTGSSDLWVTTDISGATDSGKSANLPYAVGNAAGDIFFANLGFDNYTVDNQAFLYVANASSFSTDISAQGYNGLVGLGPNTGSLIRKQIGDGPGDAMLDRIFQQNLTSQNYITFMLNRLNDPGNNITGQITISEIVAGYENITNQPKLSVVKVPGLTDEDQHWQIYTDKNGVIGPDGQVISIKSIVPKAPDGQLVAVFDSGFTFPQVPRSVSDAIYGRVQGAEWNTANQLWTIPCTQLLNISFMIGGQNYPIHPLDVSSSDFGLTDSNGNPVCAGTFQPITSAFSLLGEYDIILGMGFLRNTYSLIDFGDFVGGSSTDRGDGFIQLLSVTDVNQAHTDFVKVRLNGVDTSGDASQWLLPASQGQTSPESEAEKRAHLEEKILSRWPYILLGSLVLTAALVGLCIWKCCCKRCRKGAQTKRLSLASVQLGSVKSPYKTLDEPKSPQPMGTPLSPPPNYDANDEQSFRPGSALQDPYRHNAGFQDPYRQSEGFQEPHQQSAGFQDPYRHSAGSQDPYRHSAVSQDPYQNRDNESFHDPYQHNPGFEYPHQQSAGFQEPYQHSGGYSNYYEHPV